MTHAEAVKMVRGKTNRNRRKVGNNTYAEILPDGSVGITLHSTMVVRIYEDGTYLTDVPSQAALQTVERWMANCYHQG